MKYPFSPEVRQRIEAATEQVKTFKAPMSKELSKELTEISQWVLSEEYHAWMNWKDAHPNEAEE